MNQEEMGGDNKKVPVCKLGSDVVTLIQRLCREIFHWARKVEPMDRVTTYL